MGIRHEVTALILSAGGLASATRAMAAEPAEPASVPESPPARFGDRGEVAVSGASSASLQQTSWAGGAPAPGRTTTLFASGTVVYFVARDVSLGARVGYEHVAQSGYPTWDFVSMGPIVGLNIPLGKDWSIWPDVHAAWVEGWGGGTSDDQTVSLGGDVPVLFHPVSHLFVGIGPTASTTILIHAAPDAAAATQYGFSATIGGWLGT